MTGHIHPEYLPYTTAELGAHFAKVTGRQRTADDYVRYYVKSARRYSAWLATASKGRSSALDVQIEKDERFWTVTALMRLYHGGSWASDLVALLKRAFPKNDCPLEGLSWEEAFGPDTELYFEVSLPSPAGYGPYLRGQLERRVLIPHLLKRASVTAKLEGATKVDAVVVSPTTHAAIVFEAKVMSDVSTAVTFDAKRNQLARLIDVTLDHNPRLRQPSLAARRPSLTCVVLLTPELFRDDPDTRLYGHLHETYRESPCVLARHLPHRTDATMVEEASRRIGWTTWEDVAAVRPGSLPWLARPTPASQSA